MWNRVKRLFRAVFGGLIDKAEDPELVLQQVIRDMRDKVPQMNEEVPPAKPPPPPRLGYGDAIARAAELARAEGRGMVPAVASYEADLATGELRRHKK